MLVEASLSAPLSRAQKNAMGRASTDAPQGARRGRSMGQTTPPRAPSSGPGVFGAQGEGEAAVACPAHSPILAKQRNSHAAMRQSAGQRPASVGRIRHCECCERRARSRAAPLLCILVFVARIRRMPRRVGRFVVQGRARAMCDHENPRCLCNMNARGTALRAAEASCGERRGERRAR
jgi:hypothetical protein